MVLKEGKTKMEVEKRNYLYFIQLNILCYAAHLAGKRKT